MRFEKTPWGNLATKRKGSQQTQHFVFDAEDRLVAVKTHHHRGTSETRFAYDALGRRISVTEHHAEHHAVPRSTQAATHTRRFVWQGLRMVQELGEHGCSSYVYSPDSPYTPLARLDVGMGQAGAAVSAARVLHFHTDLVGAPLEVTTEQGELAWAGRYQAWGKVTRPERDATGQLTSQPLRFAGQYADDSTGLHYNTFRYYDPDVGRFISQDPIGLAGGENLYAYAPNPSGWVDPWGWCAAALGRNMKAAGVKRPANTTPHHIAGDTSKASLPGRDILKKHGIHHDDAVNGVFLPNRNNVDPSVPGILHNGRHPNVHVQEVNRRLVRADQMGGKQQVLKELSTIGQELLQAARNTRWAEVL